MPKTKLGKWSMKFIIAFFVLFALFQILVISGQKGGETEHSALVFISSAIGLLVLFFVLGEFIFSHRLVDKYYL